MHARGKTTCTREEKLYLDHINQPTHPTINLISPAMDKGQSKPTIFLLFSGGCKVMGAVQLPNSPGARIFPDVVVTSS